MEPCEGGAEIPSLEGVLELELSSRGRGRGVGFLPPAVEDDERQGTKLGRRGRFDQSPDSVSSSFLEELEDSLVAGENLGRIDSQGQEARTSLDRGEARPEL
ncbi:uncharacterized protein MYCFIDRAFT_210705 [Pseudocercospora fijiensis CIRAD86]|uniref:Uncharacterized protein n=1 Tax=Pseudocercospora fijiensis (strain CIRAD86) TaxID=383855 RepID=M3B342_PSEFD|nr:uncharacterized protein MYCFIDRAFT_210705 [Pseudocercospora fijiensis CIRAD86]EME83793.1 hypothetical protein MYCFIDRAFT_210705 [Pseudocercospora fijiensis CIRAD86]